MTGEKEVSHTDNAFAELTAQDGDCLAKMTSWKLDVTGCERARLHGQEHTRMKRDTVVHVALSNGVGTAL